MSCLLEKLTDCYEYLSPAAGCQMTMGGGRNRVVADDMGDGEAERRSLLRKRKAGKVSLILRPSHQRDMSFTNLCTEDLPHNRT